jgi:hypothetical protein
MTDHYHWHLCNNDNDKGPGSKRVFRAPTWSKYLFFIFIFHSTNNYLHIDYAYKLSTTTRPPTGCNTHKRVWQRGGFKMPFQTCKFFFSLFFFLFYEWLHIDNAYNNYEACPPSLIPPSLYHHHSVNISGHHQWAATPIKGMTGGKMGRQDEGTPETRYIFLFLLSFFCSTNDFFLQIGTMKWEQELQPPQQQSLHHHQWSTTNGGNSNSNETPGTINEEETQGGRGRMRRRRQHTGAQVCFSFF